MKEKIKQLFNGFKKGFGSAGHLVSNIVNTILLLIVYVLGIGIISLYFNLKKKDLLNLKTKTVNESYWQDKKNRNKTKEDSLKPF